MKKITTLGLAFVASALAGAVLGGSTEVSAYFVRSHATKCYAFGGNIIDSNFALANDSATNRTNLRCPAEDTTSLPKHNTVTLNVHGYDDHSAENVNTSACRSTFDVVGGACQTGPSSSGLGNYALTIPTSSVWTSARAADFGYYVIGIPTKEVAGDFHYRSSYRGSYQTN